MLPYPWAELWKYLVAGIGASKIAGYADNMQVTGSPHGREQPLATFSPGKEPNGRDVWDVPRPRYSGSCSCSPPYGSRLSPAHCCIVQGTAVWGGEGGRGGYTLLYCGGQDTRVPEYLST